MRLLELLNEIRTSRAPFRKSVKSAIPDLRSYDDLNNNSNYYMAYRFGLALATSPGREISPQGPVGNKFVIVDYTDADSDIRKGAEKNLGLKSSKKTSKTSTEADSINKISPVAKTKKNQYGV